MAPFCEQKPTRCRGLFVAAEAIAVQGQLSAGGRSYELQDCIAEVRWGGYLSESIGPAGRFSQRTTTLLLRCGDDGLTFTVALPQAFKGAPMNVIAFDPSHEPGPLALTAGFGANTCTITGRLTQYSVGFANPRGRLWPDAELPASADFEQSFSLEMAAAPPHFAPQDTTEAAGQMCELLPDLTLNLRADFLIVPGHVLQEPGLSCLGSVPEDPKSASGCLPHGEACVDSALCCGASLCVPGGQGSRCQ